MLRPDVRLARGRDDQAGQRSQRGDILRRGDRGAGRLPKESPLGGPTSFGHPGRGGSLGFGDPESGIAFGYVVSHIRQDLNDNRAGLLVQAVKDCLE
jgi:CubicO group peptidase (beta-lactamase class C family)